MGECVLTRRSVIKGEYQLLADIIVSGSAVTQVDISGLNIGKGEEIVLVSDVVNALASDVALNLYVNNNTTATNYYTQILSSDGASVSGVMGNVMRLLSISPSTRNFMFSKIKLTNNGNYVVQTNATRSYGTNSTLITETFTSSTFTLTSITQLTVTSNTANAIGVGSRFQLYKVGG